MKIQNGPNELRIRRGWIITISLIFTDTLIAPSATSFPLMRLAQVITDAIDGAYKIMSWISLISTEEAAESGQVIANFEEDGMSVGKGVLRTSKLLTGCTVSSALMLQTVLCGHTTTLLLTSNALETFLCLLHKIERPNRPFKSRPVLRRSAVS